MPRSIYALPYPIEIPKDGIRVCAAEDAIIMGSISFKNYYKQKASVFSPALFPTNT